MLVLFVIITDNTAFVKLLSINLDLQPKFQVFQ